MIVIAYFLRKIFLLSLLLNLSCSFVQDKTQFSEKALAEKMISFEGVEFSFSQIQDKYKGKKLFIEVWASWCGDCIEGISRVKELQAASSKDIVYLFLSVDKNLDSWRKGIKKYGLKGEHYFIPAGWKSEFNNFLKLDWIPRFMVVGESGEIELYKITEVTNKDLEKAILE